MKWIKILPATALVTTALLASLLVSPAGAAASTSAQTGAETTCRLITFDTATVAPDEKTGRPTLTVTGVKPTRNLAVVLEPAVYVQQPDYWLIMVNGCSSGIDLPVITPYVATLDISSTLGKLGIEVSGSNKQVRIPVPGPFAL